MLEPRETTFGDYLVFLLLAIVTFGIYAGYWSYSRRETAHRYYTKQLR